MPPKPGESYLELSPDGALNAMFVSVSGAEESTASSTVDWSGLFAEARLDATTFSPVAALPIAPVRADTRAAWVGPSPDGSGVSLRIEAAAVAGRPVYFRIAAPWTPPLKSADVPADVVYTGVVFLVLLAVAAVLARRNLQTATRISAGRSGLPRPPLVHRPANPTSAGGSIGGAAGAAFDTIRASRRRRGRIRR